MYNSITASSFVASDENIRDLLEEVSFTYIEKQDYDEPFCHSTHKNLSWKVATFRPQALTLSLTQLYNIKYVVIKNFTHGAQMTIEIAEYPKGPFVEVYKDTFICKGRTVKGEERQIDLGALPCRAVRIKVTKGVHISCSNVRLVGIPSERIEEKLGMEYFNLLVANPQRIMFS